MVHRRRVLSRCPALGCGAAAVLVPALASAAVWGGFDQTRVNYAAGVLETGLDHEVLRSIITANGDTIAPSTGTLDATFLSGIDVFYTSLLTNGGPPLSAAEQTALQDWIASGGTLIVTGASSAGYFPSYESFTAPFGVTGWAVTGATLATVVAVHPLTAGVVDLDPSAQSTFVYGPDALELATDNSGTPFMVVLEPSTGFCEGGRVLVLGDHNLFDDNGIVLADDTAMAQNMVAWAAVPGGSCGVCGDGVLDGGEQCDDANLDDTDDCLSDCTLASCGDGVIWAGIEQCDDGNLEDTDECLSTCVPASCGDGAVWAGMEQCDDGNPDDTDACPTTCQNATCGDGFLWAGMETCDDGNLDDTDACPTSCEDAFCGDGFVLAGTEQCDDGNGDNGDACPTSCQDAFCGDGFVLAGTEQCDDGNTDDDDACPTTCEDAFCGDGFVQTGVEECDDGNTDDADDCSNACTSNVAGTTGDDPTTDGTADDTGDTGGGSGAEPQDSSGGGPMDGTGSGGDDDSTGTTTAGAGDDGGCGCRGGTPSPGRSLLFGLLSLLAIRRRRG